MVKKYIILFFVGICVLLFSCKARAPKEYIEKNGLHSGKKPHELAKEFGSSSKRVKKQYRKDMAKRWKKMHPGEKKSQNPYR